MTITTTAPMAMRFRMDKVATCVQDLKDKRTRIDHALSQLEPLLTKPKLAVYEGEERRKIAA